MNREIQKFDTVKDKQNVRYRVMDVDGDNVKIVQLVDTGAGVKVKGGRPRTIKKQDIGTEYTMLNFPPVEVSHVEQKGTSRESEGNQPKPHTLEDTFEEFRKKNEEDIEILKAELKDKVQECIDLKKTISKMSQSHDADLERYRKAEQDLREINEELGEENSVLKRKCQELERINQNLRENNDALISIADQTATAISIIDRLMEERR